MIKVECDYKQGDSALCYKGKLLIYGEMGGRLPERIDCPKCKGTGIVEKSREEIQSEINDLEEEKAELQQMIDKLNKLLK